MIRTISYLDAMRLQNVEHCRIGIPTLHEVLAAKNGLRTIRGEVVKVLNILGWEPLGSPYRIICKPDKEK